MNRELYDLTHYSATCGNIGRLQTLSIVPIVANDSMDVSISGAVRLSPLKRVLTLDAKVEIYTFYVPYRHIFKDQWNKLISEGISGTETLGAIDAPSGTTWPQYLGIYANKAPTSYVAGYAQIWNNFFRVPNVTKEAAEWMPEDALPTDATTADYGRKIANLPNEMTSGVKYTGDIANRQVAVADSKIDLVDIRKAQSLYKTTEEREWFQHRYRDLMDGTWGSGMVSTDADQRPTLLAKTSTFMSGIDVDGTGDANLGQYQGKSSMMINHSMPAKHFKEHGLLFNLMSVRFPCITAAQQHRFVAKPEQQDYRHLAADPEQWNSERPIPYRSGDFFGPGATVTDFDAGWQPFGQWYRTHPSHVHNKFMLINGFPFRRFNRDFPGNTLESYTYDNGIQDMYQSESLEDWNITSKISIGAKRVIPKAQNSIVTGSKQGK